MNVGDVVQKNGSRARNLSPYESYTVTGKAGPFIKVRGDNGQETDWLKSSSFYLRRVNTFNHIRYMAALKSYEAALSHPMHDTVLWAPNPLGLETMIRPYLAAGYTVRSKKKITLSVPL